MNRIALLATAFLILLAAALPAAAAPARKPDTVTLTLSAEGWVEARSALVRAAYDAAMKAEDVAQARPRIEAALDALSKEADWHVTLFDRQRDEAGLERWHVEAEARVSEETLAGIYDRAKAASRPGEQIEVRGIDFTPTLAERQKVLSDLRAKIYAEAEAEAARLNGAQTGRAFRVHVVEFAEGPGGPVPLMARPAKAEPRAGAVPAPSPVEGAAPLAVAERIELQARVVLATDGRADDKAGNEKD